MLDTFFTGILLGFGVSVPFGPVNVLILSYALRSYKNALFLGFGALCADMLYLFLIRFGLFEFVKVKFFTEILSIFGFCFLSYMAFLMLKKQGKIKLDTKEKFKEKILKSFAKGFFLNALNPIVIGFWLSISSVIISYSRPFFMLCGVLSAILFWIFFLSSFVAKFSHFLNEKTLRVINLVSAIIIEYFACYLLYKLFVN